MNGDREGGGPSGHHLESEGFWCGVLECMRPRARAIARRFGWDVHSADDLAQEALIRLLRARLRGGMVMSHPAWLSRVLWNLAIDHARAGSVPGVGRGCPAVLGELGGPIPDPGAMAPLEILEIEELTRCVLEGVGRLPPPFSQIARLQYIEGWTRREISRWLMAWRPVAPETCRGLIRRTHRMVENISFGAGDGNPGDLHGATGNPWQTTPPPAFSRIEQ